MKRLGCTDAWLPQRQLVQAKEYVCWRWRNGFAVSFLASELLHSSFFFLESPFFMQTKYFEILPTSQWHLTRWLGMSESPQRHFVVWDKLSGGDVPFARVALGSPLGPLCVLVACSWAQWPPFTLPQASASTYCLRLMLGNFGEWGDSQVLISKKW